MNVCKFRNPRPWVIFIPNIGFPPSPFYKLFYPRGGKKNVLENEKFCDFHKAFDTLQQCNILN